MRSLGKIFAASLRVPHDAPQSGPRRIPAPLDLAAARARPVTTGTPERNSPANKYTFVTYPSRNDKPHSRAKRDVASRKLPAESNVDRLAGSTPAIRWADPQATISDVPFSLPVGTITPYLSKYPNHANFGGCHLFFLC